MRSIRRATGTRQSFFAEGSAGTVELKLDYALQQELELALLIGESGLGKSCLLRRFVEQSRARGHVAVDLFFPQLSGEELLAFIDGELGTPDHLAGRDRQASLRRIARRAARLARRDRALILAIDDAHLLDDRAALEVLQSLLNLRERESVQITIVLAGQKALLANLAGAGALTGRVGVTALLTPLELGQTAAYLRRPCGTLGQATSFDDGAVELLHRQASGNPRSLNRLAEMAALLARADGRDEVTAVDVESLASEIGPLSQAA